MKNLYMCCLVLFGAATGSAERECTAVDETTLKCQFPENINVTKKDFGVNFYPFTGGEEPVVECTWIKSQLHCITQMGFKREGPVSDTAVITIPTNFSDRNGNYKCVDDGYPYDSIKPCQFSDKRDTQHFSACEAKLASGKDRVILECRFPFNTDSFSVKYNATFSVKFTKSSCQNSTLCHYKVDNNLDIFTIELSVPVYPYGEYLCNPDNAASLFEVKGCSMAVEVAEQHRKSSIPVWALIVVCTIFAILSIMVLVLLIIRKRVLRYLKSPRTSAITERNIRYEYQSTRQIEDNDSL